MTEAKIGKFMWLRVSAKCKDTKSVSQIKKGWEGERETHKTMRVSHRMSHKCHINHRMSHKLPQHTTETRKYLPSVIHLNMEPCNHELFNPISVFHVYVCLGRTHTNILHTHVLHTSTALVWDMTLGPTENIFFSFSSGWLKVPTVAPESLPPPWGCVKKTCVCACVCEFCHVYENGFRSQCQPSHCALLQKLTGTRRLRETHKHRQRETGGGLILEHWGGQTDTHRHP